MLVITVTMLWSLMHFKGLLCQSRLEWPEQGFFEEEMVAAKNFHSWLMASDNLHSVKKQEKT